MNNTVKMLRGVRTVAVCLWLSLSCAFAQANVEHNSEEFSHYTLNFSAFNSLFVPADIAQLHDLVRAKDQALINVAVLDNRTGATVAADIKGQVRNLMQQSKTIDFKVINEPDAVYYIGSIRYTNEEVLHFDIEVRVGDITHKTRFTRKLYVEP